MAAAVIPVVDQAHSSTGPTLDDGGGTDRRALRNNGDHAGMADARTLDRRAFLATLGLGGCAVAACAVAGCSTHAHAARSSASPSSAAGSTAPSPSPTSTP